MNKTFTQNDLIRFIYDEMSVEEADLLTDSLRQDIDLKIAYDELKACSILLDSTVISKKPSAFTISKIQSYARAFSSTKSNVIDRIDLILN